ncbi:MAG: hypothetical protein KC457_32260, partial [Myxococcales bacterium]|nr:hypothetical protein [Myxococcales bacterium]
MRHELLCCSLLMASACGPRTVDEGGDEQVGDSSSSGSSDSGSSDSGSSDSGSSEGPSTGAFIIPIPDNPGENLSCVVTVQDCPEGEKCSPNSYNGDSFVDAAKCVVVMGDKPPGSPCTLVDWSDASDDCDENGFCLADADGGPGICHAFCGENQSTCPVGESCLDIFAPDLALCTADCDVLLQDCPEGEFCYDLGSPGCAPSHRPNTVMKPCEQFNDCVPGLYCAPASMAPSCTGDACCLPYCDQVNPDCSAL